MARSPLLEKLRGGTTRQPNPTGVGLLKGLGVTLKTMLTPAVTQQYPHVKPDLAPRTRGVIALMDENCTVCMLCAQECPDWCIYIESHKETVPASGGGGRTRTRNQLDRFAIDYALCMYCGICVEVCPFDALFWSPEFEYSTYSIGELLHEKEKLREWMDTVPPPPPLEEGAELAPESAKALEAVEKEREKALQAAAQQAQQHAPRQAAAAGAAPAAGAPAAPSVEEEIEVEAEVDQETYDRLIAEGKPDRVARARAKAAFVRREKARIRAEREAAAEAAPPAEAPAEEAEAPAPEAEAPPAEAAPAQAAAAPAEAEEEELDIEPGAIDQETFDQLIAEGKSERIARARAKAAAIRKAKARAREKQEGGG